MLTLTLVCVGRAKAGHERDLASRYLERSGSIGRSLGLTFEVREITESRARRAADRKREEADAICGLLEGRATDMIAFDETGDCIDSTSFAAIISRARAEGSRSLVFVIGGPDGLDASIRDAATRIVAFGAMTWPHQLVRIMAAEQIYRALTVAAGHPYHRS